MYRIYRLLQVFDIQRWTAFIVKVLQKIQSRKRRTYITISFCCFLLVYIFQLHHRENVCSESWTGQTASGIQKNVRYILSMVDNARIKIFEQTIFPEIRHFDSKQTFSYPMLINNTELNEIIRGGNLSYKIPEYKYKHRAVLIPGEQYQGVFAQVSIVLLVKSAVSHVNQRRAIRITWGNKMLYPFIRTVFLLGISHDSQEETKREAEVYGDIVLYDFIDTYYNNTLKMISGLLWADEYCSDLDYIVFLDDDYYLSPINLLTTLQSLPMTSQPLYMGNIISNSFPHRSVIDKWYISYQDYPFDRYPPTINAGTVIMSREFVRRAVRLIPYTKPIYLDDCFLGIIAHKLGVPAIHSPYIFNEKILSNNTLFRKVISSHGYGCLRELLEMWY